ncbi:UDP-N-acetylmuramate--L-alanine ligase, partial [Aduncisulcus paluster]
EIDFGKEFAYYNTTLCTKISTSNGKIELLNEQDEIVRIIETGIVLGVGAGDITYQLRH